MTRPLRVNIAGGWYHCMHRGIERRAIFTADGEYRHFLDLLGETVQRYRFRVHAYCMMGNHYHAIIQTPDANLSQGMQWLGLSYSSWFNTRHERSGPLFQGRFKSVPVENGAWAYELSLYLHLNPVMTQKLGLGKRDRKIEAHGLRPPPTREQVSARLKRIREHRWSSYQAYAGFRQGPGWLTREDLLRRSARQAGERQKAYRAAVREILTRGVDESRLEQFREVVGIGSAPFIEQIRGLAVGGQRETERRSRLRDRVSFDQVIHVVEEERGEAAQNWLHRHGDWGKWMVLRLARRYTGMTLSELGEQMGGSDYAAICIGLRRFDRRLKKEKSLNAICGRLARMLDVYGVLPKAPHAGAKITFSE